MAAVIESVRAVEVLDSRGRPTVKAYVMLRDGEEVWASVPSGASTGSAEAVEVRDGEVSRYGGMGCRRAVGNVNGEIAPRLAGTSISSQAELDRVLVELDGTSNKSRLGGNAILAVSVAFARACARAGDREFHEEFGRILRDERTWSEGPHPNPLPKGEGTGGALPGLMVNLFSGGKHAGGQVEFQDLLLVPVARTIEQALCVVDAVYRAAERLILRKYGMRSLKADEGGLAPPFASVPAMLADAWEAIEDAGYELGREVKLAVDVASTHFYRDGLYHWESVPKTAGDMIDRLSGMVPRFHIVSVEDGLAEEDWENWPRLRELLKGFGTMCLGDDLLCTNPDRIRRAIDCGAADALLLKVNQIGTLSEAAEALRLARGAGWRVVVSARSGETEDDWLADLAVGWGGDFIKVGSVRQSERLAKYNRLLEIEAISDFQLPIAD